MIGSRRMLDRALYLRVASERRVESRARSDSQTRALTVTHETDVITTTCSSADPARCSLSLPGSRSRVRVALGALPRETCYRPRA